MNRHREYMIGRLDCAVILDYLLQESVISDEEYEKIRMPLNTRQESVRILLEIMATRGETDHSKFLEVLRQHRSTRHIYDRIMETPHNDQG